MFNAQFSVLNVQEKRNKAQELFKIKKHSAGGVLLFTWYFFFVSLCDFASWWQLSLGLQRIACSLQRFHHTAAYNLSPCCVRSRPRLSSRLLTRRGVIISVIFSSKKVPANTKANTPNILSSCTMKSLLSP